VVPVAHPLLLEVLVLLVGILEALLRVVRVDPAPLVDLDLVQVVPLVLDLRLLRVLVVRVVLDGEVAVQRVVRVVLDGEVAVQRVVRVALPLVVVRLVDFLLAVHRLALLLQVLGLGLHLLLVQDLEQERDLDLGDD